MTDVTDLSARRWAMKPDVSEHSPVAALKEAIRRIENGEVSADHVIIVMGSISDGEAVTEWVQAGKFDVFGQRGLICGVQMAMFDAAEG